MVRLSRCLHSHQESCSSNSSEGVRGPGHNGTGVPGRANRDCRTNAGTGYQQSQNKTPDRILGHFEDELLRLAMGAVGQFPLCAIELSGAVDPDRCCYVEHLLLVADQFE